MKYYMCNSIRQKVQKSARTSIRNSWVINPLKICRTGQIYSVFRLSWMKIWVLFHEFSESNACAFSKFTMKRWTPVTCSKTWEVCSLCKICLERGHTWWSSGCIRYTPKSHGMLSRAGRCCGGVPSRDRMWSGLSQKAGLRSDCKVGFFFVFSSKIMPFWQRGIGALPSSLAHGVQSL